MGEGALLALLLQLSSVEFAMCLYDQPADAVPPAVSALLPEVCSLLEEARSRLHTLQAPLRSRPGAFSEP